MDGRRGHCPSLESILLNRPSRPGLGLTICLALVMTCWHWGQEAWSNVDKPAWDSQHNLSCICRLLNMKYLELTSVSDCCRGPILFPSHICRNGQSTTNENSDCGETGMRPSWSLIGLFEAEKLEVATMISLFCSTTCLLSISAFGDQAGGKWSLRS
jgi:hypothetical protein